MTPITMSMISWSFFLLAQALACAALSSNLADKKGYSTGAWFAAGFFLGILGLIAAAGLPPSRLQAEKDPRVREADAEEILEDALRGERGRRTISVGELLDGEPAEHERIEGRE